MKYYLANNDLPGPRIRVKLTFIRIFLARNTDNEKKPIF